MILWAPRPYFKVTLFLSISGLKNDNVRETFALKYELEGKMFPCKFVKIGKSVNSMVQSVKFEHSGFT